MSPQPTTDLLYRVWAVARDADMPEFTDYHDTTDLAAGVALVSKWLRAEGLNPTAYDIRASPVTEVSR